MIPRTEQDTVTRVTESSEATQTNVFDLTKRGYNPHQVDGHVHALLARVEMLERAHQQEQQRAEEAEAELARARVRLDRPSSDGEAAPSSIPDGFGHRVERVLRIAEQEAANARTTASREASALMERTHKEADAHRREIEQTLATRRAELDEEAARRRSEFDERERELDDQAAAAREEAEQTIAEARMSAEQITREAEADAGRRRDETEAHLRRRQEEADQELQRLHGLHDGVRADLDRLLASLSGQLPGSRTAGDDAAVDHGPVAAQEPVTPEDGGDQASDAERT